jgi:hypothetical protein
MKTVSTAFKEAQKAPSTVSVRRISYKRRYWVESSHAYTWESSWTVLPENEIVSVSPITGKLDTDKLNEFKISNVNLVLKNERRQWKGGKRGGYFGSTYTYPNGFEPYWTKFKIESGYEVAGVATYVPLFVGVATGFSTSSASDTVQVEVQGLEALLINANAENVSTIVDYENMGTGNGSNKDFTTVHPGVGIVKNVYLNGISKKPGPDYSISQLNDPALGAKISFTTAPGSGVVVTITYRYWKQDVKIESIVKDLLTEAGIPSINQIVDNVILSAGVITKQIETSQADFNAGTYDKTEGDTSPGSIKLNFRNSVLLDDFSDGDLTSSPAWIGYQAWNVTGGKVYANTHSSGPLYTTNTFRNGEFGVTFYKSNGFISKEFVYLSEWIKSGEMSKGYSVRIEPDQLIFYWIGYDRTTSVGVTYVYYVNVSDPFTLNIVCNPNGLVDHYYNGTKIYSFTRTFGYTTNYIGFRSNFANGGFDNIYVPSSTISGTHTSRIINLGFPATSFGNIVPTYTLNAGTITFETRSSSDGYTWNSWLPANFEIRSTPSQYIQIRSSLTSQNNESISPVLDSYEFSYTSSSTTIKIANLTGETVYGAIQKFGSFANYEWGFNESENFFFRQKEANKSIDETLDASINVIDISDISDGIDRVYSEVQATYGNFDVTVGDDGLTKEGPISRYGKRRLTIDGGDILLAPDKDVATGVANTYYSALNRPRRTMKARTKLMEWLDLSDTVSLTFNDNLPARPWFFGDTSAYFGDKTLYFFGDADQTSKGMLCKVVGYRHDTENKTSEFDLEEII